MAPSLWPRGTMEVHHPSKMIYARSSRVGAATILN